MDFIKFQARFLLNAEQELKAGKRVQAKVIKK